MKRISVLLLLSALVMFVSPAIAMVDVQCFNELFQRKIGQPRHETYVFPGTEGTATIRVLNGDGEHWLRRATAAKIKINGKTILKPKDFKKKIAIIEKQINLIEGENSIDTSLWGMPGVRFRVEIIQRVEAVATIGPEGGITEISDPASSIHGMKLIVEEGTVDNQTVFTLNAIPERLLNTQTNKTFLSGVVATATTDNFLKPIIIYFPLQDPQLPNIKLPVYTFNNDAGHFEVSEFNAIVAEDGEFAIAQVTHFTAYALFGSDYMENAEILFPNSGSPPVPGFPNDVPTYDPVFDDPVWSPSIHGNIAIEASTNADEAKINFFLKEPADKIVVNVFKDEQWPRPNKLVDTKIIEPGVWGRLPIGPYTSNWYIDDENVGLYFAEIIAYDIENELEYTINSHNVRILRFDFFTYNGDYPVRATNSRVVLPEEVDREELIEELIEGLEAAVLTYHVDDAISVLSPWVFLVTHSIKEILIVDDPKEYLDFPIHDPFDVTYKFSWSVIVHQWDGREYVVPERNDKYYFRRYVNYRNSSYLGSVAESRYPEKEKRTALTQIRSLLYPPKEPTFTKWDSGNLGGTSENDFLVNDDMKTNEAYASRNLTNIYGEPTGVGLLCPFDLTSIDNMGVESFNCVYCNYEDNDNDSNLNWLDNCPENYNYAQINSDPDLFGDICDNCPSEYNPGQTDVDGNGIGDACENFLTPKVVSTNPQKGETGVSRELEWISVTFDREMNNSSSVAASGNWPLEEGVSSYFSSDMKTWYLTRSNAGVPLAPGEKVTITLNPPGSNGFRDPLGFILTEYEFSFTIENTQNIIAVPTKTISIDGNPGDWSGIAPIIEDASGDTFCETGTDITKLFLAQDDFFLYWRVDTASGDFSFGSTGDEKMPVLLFYESDTPNGPYPNGITVNLSSPNNGFVSARYDNYEWVGLYGGVAYGKVGHVAEGKIALTDFNPFNIEFVSAYYWRGAAADPQCDDSARYGDLILNAGIPASLEITLPMDSEIWDEGTYQWITWNKNDPVGETVQIEYNMGGDWFTIDNSVPGTQYYWQVPYVSSDRGGQIRITSNDHPDVQDTNSFTVRAIEDPEIRITEPDNGEIWDEGTYQWITWNKNDPVGETVRIEYNMGGDWFTIDNSVPGTQYYWQVPYVSSDRGGQIRITSNDHPDVQDTNSFTVRAIEDPEIRITEPDNGEIWDEGTYQWITWNKNDPVGETVRIEYNMGGDWFTIDNSVPGTQYYWQVPYVSSDRGGQIRITSNDHPDVQDTNSFTVRAN